MDTVAGLVWGLLSIYIVIKFARSIRIVPTKRAYIIERLGKYHKTCGPGLHLLIPFIDKVAFIQDLREQAIEVPPQECFTRDNVKIHVDGVIYISVQDPGNASYGITDYRYAAVQLAQTTTRSVIGTLDLDRTFEERDLISGKVVGVLSEVSDSWGIQVHRYELKNISPPESVRDAMERQMSAERDRRALLERVAGEKQARINNSEGGKQESINRSEGERQRRKNEAEGRANAILAVAKATAESIKVLGAALIEEGGEEAIKLQLSKSLFRKMEHMAQPGTRVLLPMDLTQMDKLLENFGINLKLEKSSAKDDFSLQLGEEDLLSDDSNLEIQH